MINQAYYETTADYSGEIPAASENTSLARIPEFAPVVFTQGNNRMIRKMERLVETEAAQEQCKARLTSEAIKNTVALSSLADQAAKLVPSSEKNVRNIVTAYASSSAQRIASRW